MDCETCTDLLLDLHYDELDEARAAEVRAHLRDCDACRAASERLQRTRALTARLALPDAPAHSAAVMAALSATAPIAAAVSGRVSAVIPIERAREARATSWLQRVGELAMRRQVAMVAISLLMVGLGLRYLPIRSPTQSVTTEMDRPEVIPATELAPTPPPAAAPAAQSPAATMRARAPALRAAPSAEGRASTRAPAIDNLQAASAADGEARAAVARGRAAGVAGQTGDSRDTMAEAPVAAAAPTPNAGGAGSGYGGLGSVPADEARQLELAMPAAPAPAPSTWSGARSSAEGAAARGDLGATIAGYQRALALDPPPSERQAIALALHRSLLSAGRIDEANRVRAQYLTAGADTSALAGQLPSVPRTQTAAGSAQPSAPRPASARPARRSSSNVNSDFNQSAY